MMSKIAVVLVLSTSVLLAGSVEYSGDSYIMNKGYGWSNQNHVGVVKRAPVVHNTAPMVTKRYVNTAHQSVSSAMDTTRPPNAVPGECYTKILIPASYKNVQTQVLVNAGAYDTQVIPAKYRNVSKRVMLTDRSYRYETIPATYRYITKRVEVAAPSTRYDTIPATYKEVHSQVMVAPESSSWKIGDNTNRQVQNSAANVMCLVKTPATYKTITNRVINTDAKTRAVTIPGRYEMVREKVVASEPRVRKIEVPPTFKTVMSKELISPSRSLQIARPPQYNTLNEKVKLSDAHYVWKKIGCTTKGI